MPKRTHKLRKNKPDLGPPLPDDIIRMILMHASHSGATVRVVCKAWLRISNSLTPFFINRMNAMQIALTKQAARRKPAPKNNEVEDDEDDEEMAECESVVAMRLSRIFRIFSYFLFIAHWVGCFWSAIIHASHAASPAHAALSKPACTEH